RAEHRGLDEMDPSAGVRIDALLLLFDALRVAGDHRLFQESALFFELAHCPLGQEGEADASGLRLNTLLLGPSVEECAHRPGIVAIARLLGRHGEGVLGIAEETVERDPSAFLKLEARLD